MERHLHFKYNQHQLSAVLHYPTSKDGQQDIRYPAVIICHGFVGNRIGTDRLFVKAARALSHAGYMVLRFDYAGCGESEGDYGSSTLDELVEQTRYALDYILDIECVDSDRVTVIGHSLGGAVALLTAAADQRIKKLVLWAPAAYPFNDIVNIVGKPLYEQSIAEGSVNIWGYEFTSRFFESLSVSHPFHAAKEFEGDVLLVHGTADDVIPVDYSFLLQKLLWTRKHGQCDKEILLQTDHTFSANNGAQLAIEKTIRWLEEIEKKKEDWYGWMI